MGCRESCDAGLLAQKFGYQRENYGVSEAQKNLNQFQFAVYYPTNWRGDWNPEMGKFDAFIRYGGTVTQAPYYYTKGYAGIYPVNEQPTIDLPQPFDEMRYS